MKSKSKHTPSSEARHVTVCLEPKFNDLLNESCSRSERAKRREAQLRLSDHLVRYSSISEVGESVLRNENETNPAIIGSFTEKK
jgi:hypothetical protein